MRSRKKRGLRFCYVFCFLRERGSFSFGEIHVSHTKFKRLVVRKKKWVEFWRRCLFNHHCNKTESQ